MTDLLLKEDERLMRKQTRGLPDSIKYTALDSAQNTTTSFVLHSNESLSYT